MKDITYYAFAENKKGQLEQLQIVRCHTTIGGISKTQSWTGKIYKSVKEAEADMRVLNCAASFS